MGTLTQCQTAQSVKGNLVFWVPRPSLLLKTTENVGWKKSWLHSWAGMPSHEIKEGGKPEKAAEEYIFWVYFLTWMNLRVDFCIFAILWGWVTPRGEKVTPLLVTWQEREIWRSGKMSTGNFQMEWAALELCALNISSFVSIKSFVKFDFLSNIFLWSGFIILCVTGKAIGELKEKDQETDEIWVAFTHGLLI